MDFMIENILFSAFSFFLLSLPVSFFLVPFLFKKSNQLPYFFNLIASTHILVGVFLALCWLAPAPMSETGGYLVVRSVVVESILIGGVLVFNGLGLLKQIKFFKLSVPVSLLAMAAYSYSSVVSVIVIPLGIICAMISFLYLIRRNFEDFKSMKDGNLIKYVAIFWIPVLCITILLFHYITQLHIQHS